MMKRVKRKPLPVTLKVWQLFAGGAKISRRTPPFIYFPISYVLIYKKRSDPNKRSVPKTYSMTRRRRELIAAVSSFLMFISPPVLLLPSKGRSPVTPFCRASSTRPFEFQMAVQGRACARHGNDKPRDQGSGKLSGLGNTV